MKNKFEPTLNLMAFPMGYRVHKHPKIVQEILEHEFLKHEAYIKEVTINLSHNLCPLITIDLNQRSHH